MNKNWIKKRNLCTSLCLCIALFVAGLPFNTIVAKAATRPSNPRSATGVTTWDCIYFGSYYQSNISTKEKIKWRVLSVNGDKAFIVADEALDCRPYHDNYEEVTWETCFLRKWLNGNFYNAAFNSTEKSAIKNTTVVNDDNVYNGTNGGNNTVDKVFLLSQKEVINAKYGFNTEYNYETQTRLCNATKNARYNGCFTDTNSKYDGDYYCWWWLRTPGNSSNNASLMGTEGWGNGYAYVDDCSHGVRPAMTIDLSSSAWSNAGTVSAKIASSSDIGRKLGLQSATYVYGSKSVDVLTTVHSVDSNHGAFSLKCKTHSMEKGIMYYIDTGSQTIRSVDGTFENLEPSMFEDKSDLYVVAKDSQGNAYKTKLLLKIVKNNELLSGSSLSFGEKTSFTLGDNVPLIGGSTMKFNVPTIPVSVVVEDGKIKVGYNITKKSLYSYNSSEGVTTTTKKTKKSFKQQWEDIRNDIQKTGYINQDYKKYLQQSNLQGGLPGIETDINYNIMGYAEGRWSNDTIVDTISGEILFCISGNATVRKQIVSVPVYLKITATASGTFSGKLIYDFVHAKTTGEIGFTGAVSLEPFVGVGVSEWLSAGVFGTGTAKVYATLLSSVKSAGLDKFTLQGQVGLKAYFAKKEVLNMKLLDTTEFPVWERGSSNKKESINHALPNRDLSSYVNDNIEDEDTTLIQDKDSDTQVKNTFSSEDVNQTRTVVRDIYGASGPQVAKAGGIKIYGYVDETGSRKQADQTVAKYVIYDENTGESSDEMIVDDDGTADYMLKLVSDGKEIYGVYLNSDKEFGDVDPELDDYAKSFKLAVVHYDKDLRKFVTLGNYNVSGNYCYNPSLTITDNGYKIVWCENEDNKILALTETNNIYTAECDKYGEIVGEIDDVEKNAKAITSIAIDEKGNILYAEDRDNLLTTGEQDIYYYEQETKEKTAIVSDSSHDLDVTSFSYQQLPSNIGNDKKIICIWDGIVSYFDEEDKSIKHFDESAYVGNTPNYYICEDEIYYIGETNAKGANDKETEEGEKEDYTSIRKLTYNGEAYVSSEHTEENGYITAFATDGTSMLYIVGTAEYGEKSSNTIKENTKLKFIYKFEKDSLEVQDVNYDYTEFSEGDTATISVNVVNTGTTNMDGLKVIIEDHNHNILKTEEINTSLVAGDSTNAMIVLSDFDDMNQGFYVKVLGIKKEGDSSIDVPAEAPEFVDIDKTELAIEANLCVENEDDTYVELEVTNSSAKDSIATVALYDEQENEVYREEIELQANSVQKLKVSDLDIADGKHIYTAKVVTDDEEFYECDNETQIVVERVSGVSGEEVNATKYEELDSKLDTSTVVPTATPTVKPTAVPTAKPTVAPTAKPTVAPTAKPTAAPTVKPAIDPTISPTSKPILKPTVTSRPNKVTPREPAMVSGFKAKAYKGKLKLTWKNMQGVSGFEIQYSTKKNYKKAKKNTISNAMAKSKSIKGLKKKKKYYIRIRAYNVVNGNVLYSAWKNITKKTK